MRKLILFWGIIFLGLTYGCSSSYADYDSSGDTYLEVNLPENSVQPSDATGNQTFELQESVHDTLTTNTGIDVDHSYIWVTVNGSEILAVDPPKPCF